MSCVISGFFDLLCVEFEIKRIICVVVLELLFDKKYDGEIYINIFFYFE